MILEFPDRQTLQLALETETIPSEIAQAPARGGHGPQGTVLVETSQTVPRDVQKTLTPWGVRCRRGSEVQLDRVLRCWPQLIPVQPGDDEADEAGCVLFDAPIQELVPLVEELLRLGRNQIAFRIFENQRKQRCQLRVSQPPVYTLLRACESISSSNKLRAFAENGRGVWIERGQLHPLASRIEVAAGQLLLIDAQDQWTWLNDTPFHDVYQQSQFQIARQPVDWAPAELKAPIEVPLSLAAGRGEHRPELWQLRGNPRQQLDELAQSLTDADLECLLFAVGQSDGEETILLRNRPGRPLAIDLVLDGQAYQSYLHTPNLFVPLHHRLQPPLRRDAVRELLAADPETITWLVAEEHGEFTPHRIADSAFHPLENWVQFITSQAEHILESWIESTVFTFDSIPVVADNPARPTADPHGSVDEASGSLADAVRMTVADAALPVESPMTSAHPSVHETATDDVHTPGTGDTAETLATADNSPAPPDPDADLQAVQQRLAELETRFLESGPWQESEPEADTWRALAECNMRLNQWSDAALCWTHCLWTAPQSPAPADAEGWSSVRFSDAPVEIDRILNSELATVAELQSVAARLFQLFSTPQSAVELSPEAIPGLQAGLVRHEGKLPLQARWLAWTALAHLSGHDALMLARARDRLLSDLHDRGLQHDRDVPAFLTRTSAEEPVDARPHSVLEATHEILAAWSAADVHAVADTTGRYIDLIFAYGLATQRQPALTDQLLQQATAALTNGDPVHAWLLRAYTDRIQSALNGQLQPLATSDELLRQFDELSRMDRYKIDRLRQHSRILEPTDTVDPFARWQRSFRDKLSQQLAELQLHSEPETQAQQLAGLLDDASTTVPQRIRIVSLGLQLAPRLGEQLATRLLQAAEAILQLAESPVDRVLLVSRSIETAGHFGQTQHVQNCIERAQSILADELGGLDQESLSVQLISSTLRTLLRVGMRREVMELLETLDQRFPIPEITDELSPADCGALSLRLWIAAGWIFVDRGGRATAVLDSAEACLRSRNISTSQQTDLLCTYISTLCEAGSEWAVQRIGELFDERLVVRDRLATKTHFSLTHIRIAETAVRGLGSQDTCLHPQLQNWLEADEFWLRRRVHDDLKYYLSAWQTDTH